MAKSNPTVAGRMPRPPGARKGALPRRALTPQEALGMLAGTFG